MTKSNKGSKFRSLILLNKWSDKHGFPSTRSLYHLAYSDQEFQKCLIRFKRRLLIDEEKFFAYLENQQVS